MPASIAEWSSPMNRAFAAACLVLSMPSVAFAARSAPLAVLHYESEDKLVFLPVRFNGSRPLTFVLDSGAPHSIVDSTVAEELKVQRISADRVSGAGKGTVARQHAAPVDLRIGTVPLHVEDPWVIDLGKVGGIRHVDGLVGADLFERYVVGIDPVRQTLTIAEPATFRARGGGTSIP